MACHIRQYGLQQGALEIQYIEEFFGEFPRRKSSSEVLQRLSSRDHQIVMAEAPLASDPDTVVPVAFKVSHELRALESDKKLADLVSRIVCSFRTAKFSTVGSVARVEIGGVKAFFGH